MYKMSPPPGKQLSRSFLGHGWTPGTSTKMTSLLLSSVFDRAMNADSYCLAPGPSHTREAWTLICSPACYFGTPWEPEMPAGTFLFRIYLAPWGPNPGQCLGILELRLSLISKLSWHGIEHSWLVHSSMPQGHWQRPLLWKAEVYFRGSSESFYLSSSLPMLSYGFWKPCSNMER